MPNDFQRFPPELKNGFGVYDELVGSTNGKNTPALH
jgi:hypothetical protein